MLLTFMESQDRNAEIKGMRNSPSAGSQLCTLDQSQDVKKFHLGKSPRFSPRKL